MSRRVVVLTGASGLVGTWLRKAVPAEVELVAWTHRTDVSGSSSVSGDLRDGMTVATVLARIRPSLVLHAAVAVDEVSITGATRNIAEAASMVGADVLHVSTDAVLPGDGRACDELAVPDPVYDYGRWKADAEQIIRRGPTGWAVVRLPLVVSLDPADHVVARIREGALRHEPTRWFDDEIRQPAMAADLARALWQIASLAPGERAGTWHLPGPESLSRSEIARRVVDALGLDPGAITSGPSPPDGGRPRHLSMLSGRARDQLGWDPTPILS